jgi:hypothetical protein
MQSSAERNCVKSLAVRFGISFTRLPNDALGAMKDLSNGSPNMNVSFKTNHGTRRGSLGLNRSRALLLLALATVCFPSAYAAAEPLYVSVYADRSLHDSQTVITIHGQVTRLNGSAVALAGVSIQVNDPYGSSLHIAFLHSDSNGAYSDAFQLPNDRPGGNYAIYVTASKPGFQDASAKMTFLVGMLPFSINISPTSVAVTQGENATFRISLENRDQSSSPIQIEVTGLPTAISYSLGSHTANAPSNITLSLKTSTEVAPGSYDFAIIGRSAEGESTANAGIIVREAYKSANYGWMALSGALFAALVLLAVIFYRRRMPRKKMPSGEPPSLEGLALTPSALLSLPDHLRKTAIIVCQLGEASAAEVAARSGRARAAESDYLNQLARMGILEKRRKGRESYFTAKK